MGKSTKVRVLVADDEPDICEVLSEIIRLNFDAEVLLALDGNQAIDIIQKEENLDAVICDYVMKNLGGGDVFEYITDSGRDIPFILCSTYGPDVLPEFRGKRIFGHVQKPSLEVSLIRLLTLIEINKNSDEKKKAPENPYCKIPIDTISNTEDLASDLFIKISNKKYLKLLKKGEEFDRKDHDHYKGKRLEHLYIRKKEASLYLTVVTRELSAVLGKEKISLKEAYLASRKSIEILRTMSQSLGVSPELEGLAREVVNTTVRSVSADLRLKTLLEDFDHDPNEYIASHSTMLSYLIVWIAKNIEWVDNQTLEKLALASILHDVTIKNEELAQVQTLSQLKELAENFSAEEHASFISHPNSAALIARKMSNPLEDVDIILRQHHERPDGSGFPIGTQEKNFHPLTCLFIISHDLLNYILTKPKDWSIEEFLERSDMTYPEGKFKKIQRLLLSSISKKAPPELEG